MVGFGSQIQGVQGDEPGEAVMLDGSGNVPGGGGAWKVSRFVENNGDGSIWQQFLDAFDAAPTGSFCVLSATVREGGMASSYHNLTIYKSPRTAILSAETNTFVAFGFIFTVVTGQDNSLSFVQGAGRGSGTGGEGITLDLVSYNDDGVPTNRSGLLNMYANVWANVTLYTPEE